MKKFLTLTGIIAISTGAGVSLVNSTDIFSNHQKTAVNYVATGKMDPSRLQGINKNGGNDLKAYNKSLDPHHRPLMIGSASFIFSFTPEEWETITKVYSVNKENDRWGFVDWFTSSERGYNIDSDVVNDQSNDKKKDAKWMRRIAEEIFFDKFSTIAEKFTQSSRSQRLFVDLTLASNWPSAFSPRWFGVNLNDVYVDADVDTNKYKNKYFENLKADFNGDYEEENKVISLGLLSGDLEANDNPIWVAIGAKYPKITKNMEDQTKLILKERTDFNPNEGYTYSFVLYVDQSNVYSIGRVNIKFVYTTEKLINEIMPKLIKENGGELLEFWNVSTDQWYKNVLDQWKHSYPHKTRAEKKEWRQNVLNESNNKTLHFLTIMGQIDLKLKQQALYTALKELEKDVQDIQKQVNNLEKLLVDLIKGQTTNANKRNLADLQKVIAVLTGAAGLIPGAGLAMGAFGFVINTILTIVSW